MAQAASSEAWRLAPAATCAVRADEGGACGGGARPWRRGAEVLSARSHRRVVAPCSSQVKSIAEMGAYVSLLEYNGIEGMILLSELSRRRIRSITKLIKVGGGAGVRAGSPAAAKP